LVLTDEKLEEFDTRCKVTPPLRTETDRLALIEGVKNGTIDMITSDHNPIDIEHKKMDFDTAKSGSIGLESAFGALMTVLPVETVIEKLTAGRTTFGIESPTITESAKANLSLFNHRFNPLKIQKLCFYWYGTKRKSVRNCESKPIDSKSINHEQRNN
jgi:dihydroorotase